jgi:hypothetical protein
VTEPAEDPRLRLAYEEGHRLLDQQRDDLERLRARAVSLASVTAVSAGLLIGLIGRPLRSSVWLYPGLAAFVVAIVSVGVVLAPQTQDTATNPRTILSGYVDGGYDAAETLRWVAEYSGRHAETNRERLTTLARAFLVTLGALVAMVLCLSAAVIAGR